MDPIQKMYQMRDEAGREQARRHKKPAQRFRASELSDCKRKIFYRHSGWVPAPETGFTKDWSIDGDVHHDLVRQQLLAHDVKLAGITQNEDGTTDEDQFISHEFEVDGVSFIVSTRQDGWIYHEDYGWLLMEIKSVGHWKYDWIRKAWLSGGHSGLLEYLYEKYPNYIYQMQVGLAIARERKDTLLPFDESEKHSLDHAYLVVKDRSNCHLGFHSDDGSEVLGGVIIPYDQELVDKVLRRLAVTKKKVTEGDIPRPEYTSSSNHCRFCRYRYACHDAFRRKKNGQHPTIVYPDPAVGLEFDD